MTRKSSLILALTQSELMNNSLNPTLEILTVKEGTLRAVGSEAAIITLRNGRLQVTSIETRARCY